MEMIHKELMKKVGKSVPGATIKSKNIKRYCKNCGWYSSLMFPSCRNRFHRIDENTDCYMEKTQKTKTKTISDTIEKFREKFVETDEYENEGKPTYEWIKATPEQIEQFIISEIKGILEGLKGKKKKLHKDDCDCKECIFNIGYNQRESELREAINKILPRQ